MESILTIRISEVALDGLLAMINRSDVRTVDGLYRVQMEKRIASDGVETTLYETIYTLDSPEAPWNQEPTKEPTHA